VVLEEEVVVGTIEKEVAMFLVVEEARIMLKINLIRGRGYYRGGRKRFDKQNIQCYNCDRWGHFADECYAKKDSQVDEANLAKGDDEENELVMLMVTTADEMCTIDEWYLDTRCSTHMTCQL